MRKKIIKESHWLGGVSKRHCLKPVFKEGLCAYHYKRSVAKAIPYGERKGYRQATQEDFDSMRNLKLKTMGSYGGHIYLKGVIVSSDGYNKPTKVKPDPALFVVNDWKKQTLNVKPMTM